MAAESLFYKTLNKVRKERLFTNGESVILACSGGPDSVALLDIISQISPILNLKVTVAYFNHCLRPLESEREKEYVRYLSRGYGFNFVTGRGDVRKLARKENISIQEAARKLRYNFLFELGRKLNIQKVALGHHRDDSVETILLSFLKGSGLKGISGIEAARERRGFFLIRPLIDFSKDEIISYLSRKRLRPCYDSSNLKKTYLRNRLRLRILPALRKEINPRVDDAILRLGEIYSRENEYLDEVVSKNIKKVIRGKGGRVSIDKKKFSGYPVALERRFLREVLGVLGIIGEGSNYRQIENLRNFILSSQSGRKLNLAGGVVAISRYNSVCIERKSIEKRGRGFSKIRLNIPGETEIKDLNLKISASITKRLPSLKRVKEAFPEKVFFDIDKLEFPLYVRTKVSGDSFTPLGMKGRVKIKRYFINSRIPQDIRNSIPLVTDRKDIIWVVGHAISEKARLTSSTRNILILHMAYPQHNRA